MVARCTRGADRRGFRRYWEDAVAEFGGSTFVVAPEGSLTYREFDGWVNELAHGLADAGVAKGHHVAVALPSSLEMLRLLWAIQKLGALHVPLIPDSTRAESLYVLQHSEASFLITDRQQWSVLADGGPPAGPRVFVRGGVDTGSPVSDYTCLESGERAAPADPGDDPDGPMSVMYTSGSTGRPKGVLMRSSSFAAAGAGVADRMGTGAADRWVLALPLFHAAATHLVLSPAIATGSSVLLQPRFSRSTFWPEVRTNGCTASMMMPAMLAMLETNPPQADDHDNPLRVVFSHIRKPSFVDRFGVDVVPGWSSTETGGIGALVPGGTAEFPDRWVGSVMPADAEVAVRGPDGDEVPPGRSGELLVRHPAVSLGYYNDTVNTRGTFADGWVRTGDLGVLTADGQVFYHGRIKNMIKRSGENIAGEEVEVTIAGHPAVQACVVRGVPDPIRTEEVFATVAVGEAGNLTEAEVVAWCAARLSAWKVPRYVRLVEGSLPRLPNGKLDRLTVNASADPSTAWDRESTETHPGRSGEVRR